MPQGRGMVQKCAIIIMSAAIAMLRVAAPWTTENAATGMHVRRFEE